MTVIIISPSECREVRHVPGVRLGRGLLITLCYLRPGKCERSEVYSS